MFNDKYRRILALAKNFLAQRQLNLARDACHQLLLLDKKSPEARVLLARAETAAGNLAKAINALEEHLRLFPNEYKYRRELGELLSQNGDHDRAAKHLERALRARTDDPVSVALLARSKMRAGENERGLEIIQPFIDTDREDDFIAYEYASLQFSNENYEEVIRIISRRITNPNQRPDMRRHMALILGRAYEKTGEYDNAFAAFQQANSINPPPWNPNNHHRWIKRILNIFTPQTLAKLPRAANDSEIPVIISCLPRSGSTLIERIIAAHPDAAAAGECRILGDIAQSLQIKTGSTNSFPEAMLDYVHQDYVNEAAAEYLEFVRDIAPDALRITDKHPANAHFLGLINILLPQARIIDLRRNAEDNAIACFGIDLAQHHPYARDLGHFGLVYRSHEYLMQHWKRVLDLPILTINYEDLVTDQEHWTRKIIEFCELPWDDACLRYYEAGESKQRNVLATQSFDQVRKPMYTSSIGRAGNYNSHLDRLQEGLVKGEAYWQEFADSAAD